MSDLTPSHVYWLLIAILVTAVISIYVARFTKPECSQGHVAVFAPVSGWACLTGEKP